MGSTSTRSLSKEEIQSILAPLSGIPYKVLGGAGMLLHGMPRTTGDIDVLVNEDNLDEAVSRLTKPGSTTEPVGNENFRGVLVKIPSTIEGEPPYEVDVVSPAESDEWLGDAMYGGQEAIRKPWLFVLKLKAGREKDMNDASALWNSMTAQEKKEARINIKKHFPFLQDDLEAIKFNAEFTAMASWVSRNCKFAAKK
jgi:hypothetical protein